MVLSQGWYLLHHNIEAENEPDICTEDKLDGLGGSGKSNKKGLWLKG